MFKYSITAESDIRKWVAMYKEYVVEGLCTTRGTYDEQFEIYVVEYMHSTNSTYYYLKRMKEHKEIKEQIIRFFHEN